ncbi:plasma membrane ATP-binding cassette transporter [Talaromyces pinophilus]|uniref:Plasma membrane ATP-binding cassette transporter n=1 Tax=Talaromyces pinophilus TaxID=128442 RepID=A0A0B8MXJ4_TALPI|nr:plasma membrane ATP-binding cassette transporter [Talaromyces pinophilus]
MAKNENVKAVGEEGEESAASHAPWRRLFERNVSTVPLARQISPESDAGFLSKLTFSWMGSLMATGYRRPLQLNDIPSLNPSRGVQRHTVTFNDNFKEAVSARDVKNPLFTSLHRTFFREFWIGGIYRLFADLLTVGSPYTLRYLIQFAMDSYYGALDPEDGAPPTVGRGIGLLIGIVVMQVLVSLLQNHFLYSGQMVGGQARAILTAKILEKSMKISESGRAGGSASAAAGQQVNIPKTPSQGDEKALVKNGKENDSTENVKSSSASDAETEQGWSNGRVINLVSMDVHRIEECLNMVHVVWTSPIMVLVCMALLIVNLSYSALAGLGCLIVAMGFLVAGVKAIYTKRQGINAATDARVSLTQEALQGIRLIKYFSWDKNFTQRLIQIRNEETSKLQVHMAIFNAVTSLGQSLPMLLAMVSFVTFALGSGKELTAPVVFSSVALFSALLIPTAYLPGCLGQASDAWVSLQRIEEYLLAEEVQPYDMDRNMEYAVEMKDAVFIRGGISASAEKTVSNLSKSTLALEASFDGPVTPYSPASFSLTVQKGELLAVIGKTGSGKSTLLSAMTGDIPKVHGSLKFGSKIAVCPQTAWIQNTSVRNNILFGTPYDPERYQAVVTACQLRTDLDSLPNGDATEIGERGVNLSGGQKQRISLARAIYSDQEIVLLDDPLSAVDPYVGRAIFNDAILSLLKGKTRILATHQVNVLSQCDRILWLEGGSVKALGTYKTLIDQYPDLIGDLVYETEGKEDQGQQKTDSIEPSQATRSFEKKRLSLKRFSWAENQDNDETLPPLIDAEEQATSNIPWAIYRTYISSADKKSLIYLSLPLLAMAQGGNLLCGLWLAWWTLDRFDLARNTYIGIYVALTIIQGSLLYLFSLCISITGTSSSNVMLNKAIENVIRAPIWFFDTTPLGRVINRFSKDIEVMDDALPEAVRLFMISAAMMIGILGLIVAYFHWFAIALLPGLVIFLFAASYYRASAREFKRHEAVLRGIMVARFSETLSGVTTIRNYSMQSHFSHLLNVTIDNHNSAGFLAFSSQRWLALRLDTVGVILIVTSGVLVVVDRFTQLPAISGLVLTYSLGALQVLQFIVRQWSRVEDSMTATERIYEYSSGRSLPSEDTNDSWVVSAPPLWPERGAITFSDVRMRYRPGLPEVLRGFSLTVEAGEHVAIVGRTGAGKSSLVSSLFRVCKLSGGCILIDGVDISKIPLEDLRSRLSIQLQDSILFRGTIRFNLDPLSQYTDEELWRALRGAHLGTSVHLDDIVQEEGSNFSHGQRQQLALARILVRGSKIVVCDEATSSVDLETDDKIQRTLVESFKNKTVLTVAHRIRTIIHYDKVCVMDKGRIAELGSPMELWKAAGIFKSMCEESGISREDLEHTDKGKADKFSDLFKGILS